MKLSALIVAATLGVASAAPISLIYITNGRTIIRTSSNADTAGALTNIRLGHAAAFAQPLADNGPTSKIAVAMRHSGCGGMRTKMDRVREMLGLAPIVKEEGDGFFHIMPVPRPYVPHNGEDVGTSKVTMTRWRGHTHTPTSELPEGMVRIMPMPVPEPHFGFREQSTWDRLQRALNELGPWEGTAVTFVLVCGLGALLRMFFIFGILFVRARRAASQQPIALPVQGEVIFVAPPQYIIEEGAITPADEKAPVYEEVVAPSPAVVDIDAKKNEQVA